MKVLTQTAGFILFAVTFEALWMLLGVDAVEDLNIFGEAPCWPWPIGAVVLFALLAATMDQIRRPVVRNGLVFGTLAALFVVGLFLPRLIVQDGLAVGMFQFLNGYWILNVAAYWGLLLLVGRLQRSARQLQ